MSGSQTSEQRSAASLPGYRRVLRVEPGEGAVLAMLEDDLHCMAVRLRHDGQRVLAVEPLMERVPWTVCPGAADMLVRTFKGVPLDEVTARRDKQANCTHLHDLAVIGAAHALEKAPVEYRVVVSDPRETNAGPERQLEIRCGGRLMHRWVERGGRFVEPAGLVGLSALTMRDWVASLDTGDREAARLLQWASLVAHGRTMTDEQRRGSLAMRPSCFTMQPERVGQACMANGINDFSAGGRQPLEGLHDAFEAAYGP
ncbi:DUF2889 domain-containing protein [Novosphingobium mangrovi (ex Huang et al. 2023)]|uniref:DUF2889 domain-containing protein n=1 Tax=Novosphingobium mangrovi (ex Huang et al. 2023) TaxID=2976432 RepID=A0ABT2I7L7_9SPHN|nr:DUF2889 domain-containing protein [Novosphingobium mangrovi (ex Huang et al. 2023)]MCT2400809.1 DUF2889 domain-containing protein [Novosphingobium mangrovi (ex Huang et al. 2023)]